MINLIAREEFSNATGISSYEKIEDLLSLNPEMVDAASPKEFHAEQLASCLEKGVKYLAEKPLQTILFRRNIYSNRPNKKKTHALWLGFNAGTCRAIML